MPLNIRCDYVWGTKERGIKSNNRTFIYCWWDCKIIQPLWKTVRWFLNNLNIELPYDPTIPLLGIYSEEKKEMFKQKYAHEVL